MTTSNAATLAPKYLRITEASRIYSISRSTWDRAMNDGELTRYKRGKMVLMSIEEIENWIAAGAV